MAVAPAALAGVRYAAATAAGTSFAATRTRDAGKFGTAWASRANSDYATGSGPCRAHHSKRQPI